MTETTSPDTYQGWANRETWAFNVHWQNDQGFYNFVLEYARQYLTKTYDEYPNLPADEMRAAEWGVGNAVVEYVRSELPDLSPSLWENMRDNVGSWWRINAAEVGASVRESLDVEA